MIKNCIENLDTGIFFANVCFVYNKSHNEVRDYFDKKRFYDWFAGLTGDEKIFKDSKWFALSRKLEDVSGRKPDKNLFYLVINDKWNPCPENYIKLAHECLHLCQFILPAFLDRDREIEAEAYLHSHLMRQVLNIINNKK